ncbi:hypothetical protein B1B04_09185 [Lysinibacillus sp. KCTC 33748]|uniref:discoidin domain-containing protein n=1 Tax=unclassified Lysinibacillus TaxID=2636778 RepID=UPI0009A892BF|nr:MULTISPECIES: discoidin domain-containing protein [unclassified Lysinibacillus]OXS74290.1 hypothetical protein B1B04_09185 [Lysinibacillus sp. KCTC 33748]SKB63754.1 F5/8 type C domain-containing protein [Lysinibacillus sp. AC-3]
MPRKNLPTNFIGEEITSEKLKVQAYNTSYWYPSGLFNDNLAPEGQYGIVLLRYNYHYLEFTIPDNYLSADVWFTGGYYSDSGGGSGAPTTLRKQNKTTQEFEIISSNVRTTNTPTWYKYYGNLESGTYRLYPNHAYIQFNEMFVSGVKKEFYMLQSNNKTYSLNLKDTLYYIKMTSNTAPSPLVASASSVANTSNLAWKAFNNSNSTNDSGDIWASLLNTTNGWLQLDIGVKTKVNSFKITSRAYTNDINYTTCSPKTFVMQGSDDGINYFDISRIFNETDWKANETRLFTLKSQYSYRYYRLKVFTVNGGSYVMIAKLEFCNLGFINEIHSSSLNNFIKYGTNVYDGLPINVVINNKNYILQDEVSENTDGLWTTKLDRKPLSISFN